MKMKKIFFLQQGLATFLKIRHIIYFIFTK